MSETSPAIDFARLHDLSHALKALDHSNVGARDWNRDRAELEKLVARVQQQAERPEGEERA